MHNRLLFIPVGGEECSVDKRDWTDQLIRVQISRKSCVLEAGVFLFLFVFFLKKKRQEESFCFITYIRVSDNNRPISLGTVPVR